MARMAMTRPSIVRLVVMAAALVAGATACQLPPPPGQLTVTTTGTGLDLHPGDGVCEVILGAGDCTLEAAVAEGNAQPHAEITVPPGTYPPVGLAVTGDLRINWGAPAAVVFGGRITVSAGASLALDGVRISGTEVAASTPDAVTVHGSLQLRRSFVEWLVADTFAGTGLVIAPGGGVVLDRTIVYGGQYAVRNEGALVATQSSLLTVSGPRLVTSGAGASHLVASLLSRVVNTAVLMPSCSGTAPVSHGSNAFQATAQSGCAPGATDLTFFTPDITTYQGAPAPRTTAVGVDSIPLGVAGCSVDATDLLGNPRAADGDGNGEVACDAGAVERQP
jgi:hypothetical protein